MAASGALRVPLLRLVVVVVPTALQLPAIRWYLLELELLEVWGLVVGVPTEQVLVRPVVSKGKGHPAVAAVVEWLLLQLPLTVPSVDTLHLAQAAVQLALAMRQGPGQLEAMARLLQLGHPAVAAVEVETQVQVVRAVLVVQVLEVAVVEVAALLTPLPAVWAALVVQVG